MRTTFYGTPRFERDEQGRYVRLEQHEMPVMREDNGQSMIAEFFQEGAPMFVRLQSWDETREHPTLSQLMGRRVKITVEVVDE